MSDLLTLPQRPRSAEDAYCLAASGWTDCEADPTALGEDGAAVLTALGITRTVLRRLPRDAATLSPASGFSDLRSATRFILDALPKQQASLRELHALGVRGIRHTLGGNDATMAAQLAAIARDADAIAPLDWHIELATGPDLGALARQEWTLTQLPVAICLSGIAPTVARLRPSDEGFEFVLDLLHMGRTWIKLGSAVAGEGLRGFINAALAVRGDRLVWGSGASNPALSPTDHRARVAESLAALERNIPDEDDRAAVLVANPARLYGFA
jgi:predicted TIM-barrel fold metal-dependent hydrolase